MAKRGKRRTAAQRAKDRARKHRQLDREAMRRKPLPSVDPVHTRFCDALERFAREAEPNGNNAAVRKAIEKIRMAEIGWEADRRGLAAIATAILDTWSNEWLD